MIDSCAEKTYAATTITDIVARAHISRTTFYKQFDDKRACFDAAIAYCIEQLPRRPPRPTIPTSRRPTRSARRRPPCSRRWRRGPALAQLLTGDAIAVDPAVIERYRKVTIPALEALWTDQSDRARRRRTATPGSPSARPRS